MHCKDCKTIVRDYHVFCSGCGNSIIQPKKNTYYNRETVYQTTKSTFDLRPLNVNVYLGGTETELIERNEELFFFKEDVAWYEYSLKYNALDCVAAGTVYMTKKRIILYDPGFSNIWTLLSKDGDYPEQIKSISINEIEFIMNRETNKNVGQFIKGNHYECWLFPSEREYKNRNTPILYSYPEMKRMIKLLPYLKISNRK